MRGGLTALSRCFSEGLLLGSGLPANALGQSLHMHQVLQRHLDNTHYERMLQQRLANALSWALPWQCGMQSCLINRLVRASNTRTTIGQCQAR